MGVSTKTVEAWEAGTNKPIGSARRFLSVLKSDPSLLNKCNIISA
jgi:putative transcriptional regulator